MTALRRLGQRSVIVDPEVALEPDDLSHEGIESIARSPARVGRSGIGLSPEG